MKAYSSDDHALGALVYGMAAIGTHNKPIRTCFPPTIMSSYFTGVKISCLTWPARAVHEDAAPIQGIPVVVERHCECGVDKTGVGGLHSAWCPKA